MAVTRATVALELSSFICISPFVRGASCLDFSLASLVVMAGRFGSACALVEDLLLLLVATGGGAGTDVGMVGAVGR